MSLLDYASSLLAILSNPALHSAANVGLFRPYSRVVPVKSALGLTNQTWPDFPELPNLSCTTSNSLRPISPQ